MRAKVVHDNINAVGGSERLAVVTIDLLDEMGFDVDLSSFRRPDIKKLKDAFGAAVDSIDINAFKPLDLLSLVGLTAAVAAANTSDLHNSNVDTQQISSTYDNDERYDLIINTHGDLLPYYDQSRNQSLGRNKESIDKASNRKMITYCHFPLAPQLLEHGTDNNNEYVSFLKRSTGLDELDIRKDLVRMILDSAPKVYDLMMRNTKVVTNSNFSKTAIEERYGNSVTPIVVYPPVDVEKFRDAALHSSKRGDAILVVSRFSPDKRIENAIEIANLLKEMQVNAKTILVGNIASSDKQYLGKIKQLIRHYNLEDDNRNSIQIEVDASFDRLLDLMRESKVYLHPLPGEPFGISIVEAMSAGLIPVVPDKGGYTEFVPEHYQFHTWRQAADIISKILIASDNDLQEKRNKISESVSKFSIESYKDGLKKVIESTVSVA